jgi:hypothetical protein
LRLVTAPLWTKRRGTIDWQQRWSFVEGVMTCMCPHCAQQIHHDQAQGAVVLCQHCGKAFRSAPAQSNELARGQAEEMIRQGGAAPCPVCHQLIEVKGGPTAKSFVPHYQTGQRKICPHSGKPVVAEHSPGISPIQRPATSKDLSAFLTRDVIKVIACRRDAEPTIEVLTLEYLDKTDRVRLQIEALREMLGPDFRMQAYPPPLHRPNLAVWGNAGACIIASKHERGGYQQMTEAEIGLALLDLKQHKDQFFP